jgi:hypothetical protein
MTVTRERAALWVTGAAILAGAAAHVRYYTAPFEDSYITYRYARNVANGLGIVYNAGERVEGCTSLSWTLLLAAVAKLGLPLPEIATVLSLIGSASLLALTGYLARVGSPRRSTAFLIAPALVAANGTFAYFAGTGMETMFFSLLVLIAVAAASSQGKRAGVILGGVLGLAAMTRPEGAGHAVIILAALSVSPAGRSRLKAALPLFGVSFGALCAFRYAYFGDLLPNTYYAKATPGLSLWLAGLKYVEEYLTFWGGLAGAVAFAALLRGPGAPSTRSFHTLSALVCAAALLNSVLVGGDTFLFHRFLLPGVPLAAIAVAHAAEQWTEGKVPSRRTVAHAGALALIAWSAVAGFVSRYSGTRRGAPPFATLASDVEAINRQYFVVGSWLREHLPKDAAIAVNAAGIVPYASELPAIDMLGLTDAHIAHRPIPLGMHFHGHEKFDPDYVLDRGPDVIIPGLPILARTRIRVPTLAAWYAPWAPYMPGDAQLLQNPRFGELYVLRVVPVEERGFLVIFVKKASPLARSIRSAP